LEITELFYACDNCLTAAVHCLTLLLDLVGRSDRFKMSFHYIIHFSTDEDSNLESKRYVCCQIHQLIITTML